jgi:hypothetical protein
MMITCFDTALLPFNFAQSVLQVTLRSVATLRDELAQSLTPSASEEAAVRAVHSNRDVRQTGSTGMVIALVLLQKSPKQHQVLFFVGQ